MRRNIFGRIGRAEEEFERRKPTTAAMTEEERYYRLLRLAERVMKRLRDRGIRLDTPGCRPQVDPKMPERLERASPWLAKAEVRIKREAERLGLTLVDYLRRRFPWVS